MNESALYDLIRRTIAEQNGNSPAPSDPPLRQTRTVTLSAAKRVAARVEAAAERMGVRAVVAVSDAGGRPILTEAMDDAFYASYDVALQKAYTVVALKMSTMDLKPLAQPGGSLYGIQFTNDCHIVIFGGGEPLLDDGQVVGGLGVSGGSEEQDAALAAIGAKAFHDEILTT